MKEDERTALLYKVASLYFERDPDSKRLTKSQIAARIGQSPTQVANLLREAEEKGIVSIKINLPKLRELQEGLKGRYEFLRDVVVIPPEKDCAVLLRLLGKSAAEYFEEQATGGMKVGISGGYVMYEMVEALADKRRDIDIYPTAIIGRGPGVVHIDPMILVTLLWAKSGRQPDRAHYVTVLPSEATKRDKVRQEYKRFYSERKKVREIFKQMELVDTVFASIGALEVNAEYRAATQYVTKNLLKEIRLSEDELRDEGVVGDIIYSFFDENGRTRPAWNIFLSLGVDHLREMAADPAKRVVVVVGSYKMEALKAVLRGKLCNVLITDGHAAESLIASD
jgi:deoxyribonucleoside regulator